jgi:hypothetical protein
LLNDIPLIRDWGVSISSSDIVGLDAHAAYARAINLLMSRNAIRNDKKFWGEKTPDYIFHVPLLHSLFPNARFIHIYRDGRDIAVSVMPLSWGPNNVYSCARWWKSAIDNWKQVSSTILSKNQTLQISLEHFTKDPVTSLQRVCEFLALPYESTMLDDYQVFSNRSNLWKNKFYMSKFERQIFESVAGDTLSELGYELSEEVSPLPAWLSLFSTIDNGYKRFSNRILRR